jgi:glycosyltransferase involved in cell wall biosynthesis
MTTPLRILHVGNGKAFKIKAIVDAFVRRGHELHMVSIPQIDGHWDGVTWHHLPEPRVPGQAKVAARLFQVRRLANRLNPDVVHAHNAWGPGWYGAATGRHPFVIHAYGGDLLPEQYAGRPALQRSLTSWACRSADQLVVTGQHMVKAAGLLGVPADSVRLLPRGVDLVRYRHGLDTSALRRQLDVNADALVVFSPRYQVSESLYNLDVVIDAFVEVRRRFPTAVCIQMCAPEQAEGRARLERLAADRGLASAYKLVPSVDNDTMPYFYNLADVVVSVPSSDGFPVTVLEASACGAPLIVSALPYCSEWFRHGENGFIVPVRDAGAVAEAVTVLLNDPALRQAFAAAGRRQVELRADYEHCMDTLEGDYRRLIARSGAGGR